MKQIDTAALLGLCDEAAASPRLRKNLNLHTELDDPVQRLLNAFEPGTYLRPHRHAAPPKWELFVVLAGRAAVLTFADDGRVLERADLDADGDTRLVEIPEGAWHTLVALVPKTVLFEVKRGPYLPNPPQDVAAWAPPEGDARTGEFERWYRQAAPGDLPPR
jgi:cupin fold WbuC family metalloprotein